MAWYDTAVFYHIYPLGLCGCAHENDGQPTPGAFAKLNAWAEHASRDLGCTAIYIGPLFESGSHGYDTIDYRRVDRRLGTNEEFREFVANCHARGQKVIVDGVFNHVGRDFFAFKDLQASRENARVQKLFKCNAVSTREADSAEINLRTAQHSHREALAEVRVQERKLELQKADRQLREADLRAAEAQLQSALIDLGHTIITAPGNGHTGARKIQVGDLVREGMQVVSLVLDMPPYIVANYKETQIGNIRAGQPVEILIDTFPGHTFKGHVESICPPPGPPSPCCPRIPRPATSPRSSSASRCASPSSPGRSACRRSAPACRSSPASTPAAVRREPEPATSRGRYGMHRQKTAGLLRPSRRGRPFAARLRVLPSFPLFPAPPLCRPTVRRALADRDVRDSSMPLCHLKDARRPEKKPPSRAGKRAVASDRLRQD